MKPSRRFPSRSPSGALEHALAIGSASLLITALLFGGREASQATGPIRLGNDVFCRSFPPELQGKRLGLIINQTSVLPDGQPLLDRLLADDRQVTAIFTPEHGLWGSKEGGREVADTHWKGIAVHSFYGKHLHPSEEQLSKVDALIYDIQDVGTRFYTYITTLKYALVAAARAGLPFYVLDRPNPLGGRLVEGPLLKPEFESFIAALPVPTRYGLTSGELALMMKGEGWVPPSTRLEVVRLSGWTRKQTWRSTGLSWIPTSPNIPTPEAALLYPGTSLLGGINLSQGLGTPYPFLQFGAPWVIPADLAAHLPQEDEPAIRLEPVAYTPAAILGKVTTPPYLGRPCRGLRIHVLHGEKLRSLRFALALIKALRDLYPDKIFVRSEGLSQMFGDDSLALYIAGELPFETMMERMEADEGRFLEKRRKYLLYPDQ